MGSRVETEGEVVVGVVGEVKSQKPRRRKQAVQVAKAGVVVSAEVDCQPKRARAMAVGLMGG